MRFVLRDGDVLDGSVYLTEGHALSPYLSSRKGGWMNVVSAEWRSEGIPHNHVVVQSDDILFAASRDPDVGMAVGAAQATREVDILLEDGSRLQGRLQLAARQRLSDYLASCGHFIPLMGAVHLPLGTAYGDVALNAEAVKAVRDAVANHLDAPDPRMVSDRPSLGDVWRAICNTNNVEAVELATMVATANKMKLADLDAVGPEALAAVPARIARRLGFLPVAMDKSSLTIALSDPASIEIDQQLRFVTRLALKFEIASPEEIEGALSWYYGADDLPTAAAG